MNRPLPADFLRARREALQPEQVGPPRGARRRTGGLRREEVAVLAVSTEIAELWRRHEVDVTHHHDLKSYRWTAA